MGAYPGGLKSGISFALEPEWAYVRVGLYPGGPLFGICKKLKNDVLRDVFC